MIEPAAAQQIIEQYNKHGWVLRRVLFSSPLPPRIIELIGETPSSGSAIDALWFSRRSQPGREAWELRRLSGSPFALVEVIEDDADAADIESILNSVEERMARTSKGPVSH